ncbi:MAG: hypothetical protein WD226_12085 [Planctomycetota bacterium]
MDLEDLELAFEQGAESKIALPALGLVPVDLLVSPPVALSVALGARAPPEVTRTPAERAGALPLLI